MRRLALVFALGFSLVFGACSPKIVYVPIGTDTTVEKRDSIIYKVDTLKINVPVETIKEVVPQMDTLHMETSIAKATAFLDKETVTLKGTLENKKTQLSQPQVVYKEKISYRDSIQIKEISVPVEVEKIKTVTPKWAWYSLIFSIICLLVGGFYAYLHLKP